jgi:hypothetical protein
LEQIKKKMAISDMLKELPVPGNEPRFVDDIRYLLTEVATLTAALGEAEKALEWYGDHMTYEIFEPAPGILETGALNDRGKFARQALTRIAEMKEKK